ncbi:DUF2637 domain-containing protein [Streptomyces caniscabiei]|uniref:DUF2637 domain-containing protein n=1 Tax=Streptomyces caniscabiei TaxID=2746961 RepID=UPI0007658D1A|nr:DUF2637 domain-containing protein [Streptomyces caniscabiei]
MKNPTAALAAGAAAVTIALTAAAFWLSYEHLHDIASTNGLDGARAWAWPATVDLFIVAGELLVLRASLRAAVDWWAYALAAVGSLGSIALNVFGVGHGAQPMEYVVAAVPPSAALVAFGALMRQVHDALHRIQAATEPQLPTASDDFERAAEQAVEVAEPTAPRTLVLDLAPMQPPHPELCAPASRPAQAPSAVAELPTPDADAALLAAAQAVNAAALAETNRPASLRRLQEELRIGQKRAQRIQALLPRSA